MEKWVGPLFHEAGALSLASPPPPLRRNDHDLDLDLEILILLGDETIAHSVRVTVPRRRGVMRRVSAASHLGRCKLIRKGGILADLSAANDISSLHQTGPVSVVHLPIQRLRPDAPRPRRLRSMVAA